MREMKDSNYGYLGIVPQSWKVDKIKYHLKALGMRNPGNAQVLSVYREYGVIPKDSRDDNHNVTSEDTSNYRYVRKGDFVINKMKAWQGSMAVSRYTGIVSPAYYVYQFTDDALNRGYFHYLLRSKLYAAEFARISGGIRVGQWDLSAYNFENTMLLIPSLEEQGKIATFLDSQCSEIDAISADIQKEIEILEQYKRSVITEAVTKGLNPDAEMKDSGIEWVGNIPVHWDTIPIRYLFAECRLKNILNQEKTALKFTYGTIIKKTNFDSDSDEYVANTMTNYTVVYPGTIMINGLNLNYDFVSQRVGLVKDRGAITSAYLAIVPGSRVVSEYANYQLKSWDYAKAFHNMGTGVRKTLDFSELGKKYFVTPSIEEQSKIVAFLDSKCKEIEAIIASKKQQLTVIDSYKKSLIYEYVTGKKEVPAQN